ncbi:TetR/AcrR family transcriptional regulator [Bradyrhizobium neotropicale]|uniref:TetR/AcrR family transcriptional regulator n=1 Tax=Bradyrhizobium neotropicale TaxID=1497615 RepID=UPI001AD69707|nr:TetR/AcrR family transcriptional regulator [Bradyrhizobium neotropicale]MBO4225695.1 TetR family transcriptional regulator [Bradyrhizobium neotropicale]
MGRPREFDEQRVLAAAGDVFWARGYEATSTRALTECTGLTPASLYNAFGDKRGFYLRVLDYYLETLRERIARLESTRSPGRAIAGFFREVIDRSLADPQHRGCMLMNTAIEVTNDDPEMRRIVGDEMVVIERFFCRCTVAAQQNGEIPKDQQAEDIARMLLGLLTGLRVLARVRPDAKLLNGLVRPALAMLHLTLPRAMRD